MLVPHTYAWWIKSDLWKFRQVSDIRVGFHHCTVLCIMKLIAAVEHWKHFELTKDAVSVVSILSKIYCVIMNWNWTNILIQHRVYIRHCLAIYNKWPPQWSLNHRAHHCQVLSDSGEYFMNTGHILSIFTCDLQHTIFVTHTTVWYKTKFGSQKLATKFGNHFA